MARLVQKFGGTSVANLDRMTNAAFHIKRERDLGNQVAVVVSAMAGETNKLAQYVHEASVFHDTREYDVVVSAGEQVTCGLLSIILQKMGIPARSWLGWQLPIQTDSVHSRARILNIESLKIRQTLDRGEVAVIAGFQGLSSDGRITTLGRGGSDTSAVALA